MRILAVVLVILTLPFVTTGQNCSEFKLYGKINSDSGRAILIGLSEDYYSYNSVSETNIENGSFYFSDSICYPTVFKIGVRIDNQMKYISSNFYVEKNKQEVICNIDSIRETPVITNNSMVEFNSQFKPLLKKNDESYNKALKQYVNLYPSSYISAWSIARSLDHKYSPILDTIYNQLSPSIKETHLGKALAKYLQVGRQLSVDRPFPELVLPDSNNNPIAIKDIIKGNKYTLVDFWFSHCPPCKRQFPSFKKLYTTYHEQGFEIIGISTDQPEYLADWKKVVDDMQLNWVQLLDKSGDIAKSLSITRFPTNFLLDENGVILKVDISSRDLEELLK